MKYIVLDFEMCQIPKAYRTKEYRRSREIIQIGAVMLDEDYEIIDKFESFVAPKYGEIDDFINKLTGISKDDIRDADDIAIVLKEFEKWIGDDEVCCVSWSEADKDQLGYELEHKTIDIPRIAGLIDTWVDCQKTFTKKMGRYNPYNLQEALIASDIMPEGQQHDGMADAYNTAKLFAKLSKNPDYELNEYYNQAREEKVEHLSFCFGDLIKDMNICTA